MNKLAKRVRDFKSTMPIVTALGNRKLTEEHWIEIKMVLKLEESDFNIEEKQFTLGQLMEFDVGEKQEEVVHISTTATQEFKLNVELEAIIETWNNTEFNVVKHEKANQTVNSYKIRDWDAIIVVLDESLSSISDI